MEAFNRLGNDVRLKNLPAALLLGDNHGMWRKHAKAGKKRAVIQMPVQLNIFCDALRKLASREA